MPEEVQAALRFVREQCAPEDDVSDDGLLRDSGALLIVGRASGWSKELLDALKILRDYRDNSR